jgi:cysteine dioxygenase
MPLDQLIERLKGCVELEDLGGLLSRTSVDLQSCGPYIHFHPDHYARHVAYRDDRMEVVVVCWGAGQVSGVHDHGGAMGWTVMLQGTLTSWAYEALRPGTPAPADAATVFTLADGRQLVERAPSRCAVGECAEFDAPNAIHRVGNVDPDPAISLNVYSPPIMQYTLFDLETGAAQECQPAS